MLFLYQGSQDTLTNLRHLQLTFGSDGECRSRQLREASLSQVSSFRVTSPLFTIS